MADAAAAGLWNVVYGLGCFQLVGWVALLNRAAEALPWA